MTELGLITGIGMLGVVVASLLARSVLAMDTGTPEMRRVWNPILEGAKAFLKRQNQMILKLATLPACVILLIYGLFRQRQSLDSVSSGELAFWMTLSFGLGALCSGAAGYAGMWVAIRSNIRTASGACRSTNDALQAALRGGGVVGLFVTALSLLGVVGLFSAIFASQGGLSGGPAVVQRLAPQIPLMIAGYGVGASFVALFAQVGGGIYTKAVEMGADLVSKVEVGIPEDDPRNPAVIADLVGDNVGNCVGRGADLFESISVETIGAMILASSLYEANPGRLSNVLGVLLFPLVVGAFGLLSSIIGVFSVKTDDSEEPMSALNRGFYVTVVLAAAGLAGTSLWLLGPYWKMFLLCGVVGLAASLAFVHIALYYTAHKHGSMQGIAQVSASGPATNVIQRVAVGFESTALPVLVISVTLLGSYLLGEASGLENAGLFGIAVAAMGMLSTAGYILAMETLGSITDNAGRVVEMSIGQKQPELRARTNRLEAAGNTTKALTKGYAVGSAALATFLLFSAVVDEINHYG
ncbi:MAG: sodium/proton-translocating pyrophosphatase, partial [Myxococcales bacterium]|nr:sodium/proton-translocating pyrophosphatase [Polyangiaceae bacterium]MDW8251732.1 sodium/proton-translocating pyrophosphatase [Myxococcales bacterium]